MSEMELVLAFLVGVVMGILLNRWLLPPLSTELEARLGEAAVRFFSSSVVELSLYRVGVANDNQLDDVVIPAR